MADFDFATELKSSAITVEVAYALPDKQHLISLEVSPGSTAMTAFLASGITSTCPELKEAEVKLGIFSTPLDGKHLPLAKDYVLQDRDRVEVYRPLLIDPKEARMERAQKARAERERAKKK